MVGDPHSVAGKLGENGSVLIALTGEDQNSRNRSIVGTLQPMPWCLLRASAGSPGTAIVELSISHARRVGSGRTSGVRQDTKGGALNRSLARSSVLALVVVGLALTRGAQCHAAAVPGAALVQVDLFENLPAGSELNPTGTQPTDHYGEPAFGFVRVPTRYSVNALPLDRSTPFVLRASAELAYPEGEYTLRLRARGAAQLLMDGKAVLTTEAQKPNTASDDPLPPTPAASRGGVRPLPYPHQESIAPVRLNSALHRYVLVAVIGGKGLAPDPGELSVTIGMAGEVPRLLGPPGALRLTDAGWEAYAAAARDRGVEEDAQRRYRQSLPVVKEWEARHQQVREWLRTQPPVRVPTVPGLAGAANPIDAFIDVRLTAAHQSSTTPLDDLEFLRRLSLDVTGMIPSSPEIHAYLADPPGARRTLAIARCLSDPRWADPWVSYWQDVLAENPGILKPDLNNTGPFRWWLYQSFRDGLPFDRFATEVVEMEGSKLKGAPAAFGQATLNDAPMAAKAQIVSQAFLGQNLSCARCHDAPNHPFKQQELFSLSALLAGKPVTLPASSTVTLVEGFRKPQVRISLKAGDVIAPAWPFPALAAESAAPGAVSVPNHTTVSTRHHLAELLTAPQNERFAAVLVNRVWKRYMGRGLVEPAEDWARAKPSHPELLRYLSREFLQSGYDLKHLARLILSSRVYQRRPDPAPRADVRLFAGPYRRRLTAEQLVDSLFQSTGKQFNSEELYLSPAGDRPAEQFLDLGRPCRAWQMTALSNERDRPALALPSTQSIVDVLTAFGWRQSRQAPATTRDDAPSPMRGLILANGVMGTRITRLSDDSSFTDLCLEDRTLPELVRETFLRILSRPPTAREGAHFIRYLQPAYSARRVKGAKRQAAAARVDRQVSWANHLSSEATLVRMEEERRLRLGDEPTGRLTPQFRERFEDVLWALINSPEFVLVP